MLILDHTQDLSGANQHRLTQLYVPPDFVKQASHEQLCGGEDPLQPHLYGNAARRVYPCHTKAATWMSALFFGDKKDSLSPVEQSGVEARLKQAADFWGIGPQITTLWTKMAQDAATGNLQLVDDDFAMVWAGTNGSKERHYPLRNGAEVKMASVWFNQYHSQFTYADKHTVARKILIKAAAFGAAVENSELLDRCAGFGYCAAQTAAEVWMKRAGLARQAHPDYAEQAVKVAESILSSTFEARDQGKRIKMAELMDQFDRQTGLDKLYDAGGLDRPEDALFAITEKVAGDFVRDHVQTTTGAVYEKMALDRLDISHIRQWLGDEFADEVGGVMLDTTKLAEIVPTLPRPEAEMFERMAAAAGVPVFARDKTAMDRGITSEEMAALAAQYGQEQPVPEGLLTS